MKHLIKKLSKVAPSSATSYSLLRSDTLSSSSSSPRSHRKGSLPCRRRPRSVPSGHVPVYVGEENARFIISTDLMNHPIFMKLLNISAQEYGYEQKGALRIPCNVVVFQTVLDALACGRDLESDLLEFVSSYNNTSTTINGDVSVFF